MASGALTYCPEVLALWLEEGGSLHLIALVLGNLIVQLGARNVTSLGLSVLL